MLRGVGSLGQENAVAAMQVCDLGGRFVDVHERAERDESR